MSSLTSSTLSTIEMCYCGDENNHQSHASLGKILVRASKAIVAAGQQTDNVSENEEVVPETTRNDAFHPANGPPELSPTGSEDFEASVKRFMPHVALSSAPPIDTTFLQDLKVGDYQWGPKLGEGANGAVYAILPTYEGEKVYVIKTIKYNWKTEEWGRSTPHKLAAFIAGLSQQLSYESRVLQLLQHRNIVEHVDFIGGTGSKGAPFVGLVLESLDGDANSLFGRHKVNEQLVFRFFAQMVSALDYIHTLGITHLDVKPENVLYEVSHKGAYTFKLADFGLAFWHDEHRAPNIGTHGFAAPEARSYLGGPYSDIWSLMVSVVWALNAGRFRQTYFNAKGRDLGSDKWFNIMANGLKAIVTKDKRLKPFKDCVWKTARLRPSARELRRRIEGRSSF